MPLLSPKQLLHHLTYLELQYQLSLQHNQPLSLPLSLPFSPHLELHQLQEILSRSLSPSLPFPPHLELHKLQKLSAAFSLRLPFRFLHTIFPRTLYCQQSQESLGFYSRDSIGVKICPSIKCIWGQL